MRAIHPGLSKCHIPALFICITSTASPGAPRALIYPAWLRSRFPLLTQSSGLCVQWIKGCPRRRRRGAFTASVTSPSCTLSHLRSADFSFGGLNFIIWYWIKLRCELALSLRSLANCEQLDFQIWDATALKFVALGENEAATRCRRCCKAGGKIFHCITQTVESYYTGITLVYLCPNKIAWKRHSRWSSKRFSGNLTEFINLENQNSLWNSFPCTVGKSFANFPRMRKKNLHPSCF